MDWRRMLVVVSGVCALVVVSGCAREKALVKAEVATVEVEVAKAKATVTDATKIALDSEGPLGIETVGEWPDGLGGEDLGSGCKFALKGAGECKFIWRPLLPKAGQYRVSVWFGGDPNSDHATDSPFTVYYDGGQTTSKVDQTKSSGGWKVLGAYPFKAGKSGYVELTNKANGNVVADGVQFEFVR